MRLIVAAFLLVMLAVPQVQAGAFSEGVDAYNSGDYATARVKWLPLAEAGHTFALNNFGMMYKKGLGVPKNYKKAVKMFRQSADQGFSLAAYNLAAMYQSGKGVKKNRKEAFSWMKKAALKRFGKAQIKMGRWHKIGFGTKKNPVKALEWFLIADANSKGRLAKLAKKEIDKMNAVLTNREIEEAKEAAELFVPAS